eukprot:TRINITY_DN40238_c0_g1_i1.p1 TRINITY_DN40238_c0_g1~~TRINITY_DN40238_c0_g1_i1.p1  ORF type:complete len:635 (+),score=155.46 TRINITY_DN40238_c0_g1_i1:219-2123(+)
MDSALSFLCFSCPAINVSVSGRSFHCRPVMVQRSPAYRISSTVFMNTKRPSRASNRKRKPTPPISSPADDENAENTANVIEEHADAPDAQHDLLAEPEDGFENWSPVDEDDEDVSLEQLLLDDDEEQDENLDDDILLRDGFGDHDEQLEIDGAFGDDEEDDDDDEGDTEEDDAFDEDDELAAQAESEDFDDSMSIPGVAKRQKSAASKATSFPLGTVEDEENAHDSEDVLNTIADEFEPVFDDQDVERDASASKLAAMVDDSSNADFDDEDDEDIRNAANILSESGILGLGLGDEGVGVSSVTKSISSTDDDDDDKLEGNDEEYAFEELFDTESEQTSDEEEGKENNVTVFDIEEQRQRRQEDEEFTLTTESSFGKVWELNEDTYVTITEPGQAYAYELDEDDEEDQEMSTVRRGKQGGWSGGLASYPTSSELRKGSKEWIARRSYELLAKSSPAEMFQWTRRHLSPPQAIANLYPKAKHKPAPLGKQVLNLESPDLSSVVNAIENEENTGPTRDVGKKTQKQKVNAKSDSGTFESESKKGETFESGRTALDRSVEFPCSFKFKIESSGEGFRDDIQQIVEESLRRNVEPLAFSVESEGKLERIEFNVTVQNSKEITDIFEALHSDERVKCSYG